jgi:nicotinamide mononucleotide transporter PnuC
MLTYLGMSAPIAIAAVISWIRHPFQRSSHVEVEVNRLHRKEIAFLCALTVAVSVGFYFILDALGNAQIVFSTLSVTTSMLASYLTFFRSPFYALAYAANDVILIVLWVLATIENPAYLPMIFCFVMFLLNDLYGFFNWQRMKKRQNSCNEK